MDVSDARSPYRPDRHIQRDEIREAIKDSLAGYDGDPRHVLLYAGLDYLREHPDLDYPVQTLNKKAGMHPADLSEAIKSVEAHLQQRKDAWIED